MASRPAIDKDELGRAGERAALDWYLRRGFRLVARNWRSSLGELDLVVRRGPLIAFVEVKTRATGSFGGPFEAVGWKKQRKLRQLAELFVGTSLGADGGVRYRFDVASVMPGRGGRPDVHVFEDAF